jgi:hypothetical protein
VVASFDEQDGTSGDLIDRWFRALDQRLVYLGAQEWAVQVTSILHQDDEVWIQIADDSRLAGSLLLRVGPKTSVEQAVRTLSTRTREMISYPLVLSALLPAASPYN